MSSQSYSVNQLMVDDLLSMIRIGDIAIPEIQRPFVWQDNKVTELIDSLYKGYPIGYIITWKSPNAKLKDGSKSEGKKILIDGQQRITALRAAILGETVKRDDYSNKTIRVAYDPIEHKFATSGSVETNNPRWIKDISPILNGQKKLHSFVREYCQLNPTIDEDLIYDEIDALRDILKRPVGVIELPGSLDIEIVTEIFIRINSKGVTLNQADFVMSTIAANESYGGNMLRKCIDHFSELAVRPDVYSSLMQNDVDFAESKYRPQIDWLRKENDDIYDPSYVDILRVAFAAKFSRGKMSDLVNLLSGRNFETREFEENIKEDTYNKLTEGVCAFINETNFKRFIMIIRSAGFCHTKLIRSQNTLNFAYILFLKLREKGCKPELIEKYVRRWFVYSILTGRYSEAPESKFDYDSKQVDKYTDFGEFLAEVEAADLSDAYWDVKAIQQLNTSVASSPVFNAFLASQCFQNRRGFLSTAITVQNMIEQKGDVHHIFPREYLKANGLTRSDYNQVANYIYTQTEINIQIGKKAPVDYLGYVQDVQCQGGATKYGGIININELRANLCNDCCLPEDLATMDISRYQEFLAKRRRLIAQRLKEYYFSL